MKKLVVAFTVVSMFMLLAPLPADAASTTIRCNLVVTKSIVVSNSIFGCVEHGLIVEGKDVTIDLAGNFISGNATNNTGGFDSGIRCVFPCSGLRVKNGVLRGFDVGVFVGAGSPGVRISNMRAVENSIDGFNTNEDGTVLRKNVALNNGSRGFRINTGRHLLVGNVSQGNASDGFFVQGDRNTLEGNRSDGSTGQDGFDVAGDGNILRSNTATDNASDGFEVTGDNNRLVGNRAFHNPFGFRLAGDANRTSGNRAVDSNFAGFEVPVGSTNHVLSGDVAAGNGTNGFQVAGSGHRLSEVTARGNIEVGVLLLGAANSLRDSRAAGNSSDGINLPSGASLVLVGNVARDNGFLLGQANNDNLGIRVAGATNLAKAAKNRASGNDGLVQCSAAANCN